jgi:hypothetical protein
MVEAALGVGVAEGGDRLVALEVAEPVARIRRSGARPPLDLGRASGFWAGAVVMIAVHGWSPTG